MKHKQNTLSEAIRFALGAGLVASLAMTVAPVWSQDAEENEEATTEDRITVTGSRIARDDFSSESPVSVITAEEITNSGSVNLAEVLRENIAVGSGGFNQTSNLSGGGAQSIDLRNLGPDRVLTLLNGRRVANFADSLQNEAADLGFIPTAMIDRIEILRDGASAAYGADAVTGVVNVILRDDFEGLQVSAQTGISDYGDRDQYSVEFVAGGNFDRGNVVFSAEYASSDPVLQRERPWAEYAVSGLFNAPSPNEPFIVTGSGAAPGGAFRFSDGDFWCTLPKAFGGDEITNVAGQVDANGFLVCPNEALANSNAFPDAPFAGNRYDYAFQQSIITGQERLNATAFGTYDLTDTIQFFSEFQYANRKSESVLDGNPIFGGSGSVFYPGGWVVPGNNPYNPFPGQSAQVTIRPTSTIGPRKSFVDATNFRIAAGLQGTLMDRFDWEVSYLYTETQSKDITDATFNLARAIRISDPELCAADPVCVGSLQDGSLGALDVYRPGNWSQSEIDYFRQVAVANFFQDQDAVNAFISGDVFELPAGPLGIAVGAEYREESLEFRPDSVTEAGESVANQTFSTFGGFDTYEAFVEANIPLIADAPLVDSLSLNLQGRYFDYSTFGDDTVYKVGLNWALNDQVRLRGTYGTSFRIPTLVDTFSGGTVGFQFLDDPCDAANINATPERLANCTGGGPLGVPADFSQSAPQIAVLGGGDLADGVIDLGPEEGTTYTVGMVFTPEAIGDLRLSLDYYNIEVENFIDVTDVQNEVLNACFDSAGLSDPACDGGFSRDPVTGQLRGLVQTPINRPDPLETDGLDWAVAYGFDVGDLFGGASAGDLGYMRLSHQGTYVFGYNIGAGPGGYQNNNGAGAIPEYRLNFQADWEFGRFGVGWDLRYIPEIEAVNFDGQNFLGFDNIEEHWQNDLRVTYEPRETTRLLFGVNNVFNEDPPYVYNTGNNTAPGLYSSAIIGRYFFARITQEF